ncbi:MAG: O-antigen ligase family protein [Sandaracinaceae bacterium]|nr:O-antigen ligase family protein [Sandaracinaceae bacterium]
MPRAERRLSQRSSARRGRIRRVGAWTAIALLGLLVIGAPQLLGGVFGWGIAIITALAGVACLAAAWVARTEDPQAPLGPVGLAALLTWGWTVLQVIPWPRALASWLQPSAVELVDGSAALLDEAPPSWIALSIAPGATQTQVVVGAATVAAFLASAALVGAGHRRRVLATVGLSGLVMAVVGLLHAAVDAHRVFGLYEPIHDTSPLLAPLVNQNQLSGFLGMCAPLLVGLGLDRTEPRVRWAWISAGVIVGASTLMAVSRGGAASLVVGFLTLALFGSFRQRAKQGRSYGSSLLLIGAALATAVGLGLYVAADALYRDFESSGFEKLELSAMGLDLALDHPFIGVGRGAFSAAFVSRLGTTTRATNPENLAAQWASEWGILVAVLLMAVLAWSILRAARRAKSWAHLGGAAGLVGVFAHDQVDFCLELAGVGVVAAALVGAVVTESKRRRVGGAWISARWITPTVGGVALALVAVTGAFLDERSVYGLQRDLESAMRARDHERFRAKLVEAVEIHPSEPTFALLGGSEAGQRDDPQALRWLNRAMTMAPGWGAPHEEAARYLIRSGHYGQALLEIRQAGERDRPAAASLAAPPLERHPELASRTIRALRSDALGDDLLDRLARGLPRASPATIEIDTHLVDRGVIGGNLRAARRAMDDGRPEEARELLERVPGDDPRVTALLARAHLEGGHPERAIALLGDGEAPDDMIELRARAQAAAGDEAAMLASMEHLRGRAAGSASRIARIWLIEGELQEQLGNDFAALRAYSRAERMDPESEGLARTARVAERIGDLGRAYRAYGDLCQRGGAPSACRHRDHLLEQLRESRRRAGQPVGTP